MDVERVRLEKEKAQQVEAGRMYEREVAGEQGPAWGGK